MQELEYKLQSYASISCTANVEPYQKERVFVWLPSHVMISHVHSCRQPFSLLLHIVEEANDRCVCTERVVSEASQRQNFHATCPPICSWNQVLPWTRYSIISACPSSSRRRPSSTLLLELPKNFCKRQFLAPTAQRSKY
ncbi:hypothetical protein T03_11815 [Trichinella britovi]|uniref:Uncharacterized protein n=1 Tax=Trichinella britovi TaxID=45882 RepID=A0A0V1D400_TRIBR|nr:hypothetical protein T03_11815 [Trichinella britovi]